MEVILHDNSTKSHACRTAKGIMEAYPGYLFYITTNNFGKVDVDLPMHQEVNEVTNAPA